MKEDALRARAPAVTNSTLRGGASGWLAMTVVGVRVCAGTL